MLTMLTAGLLVGCAAPCGERSLRDPAPHTLEVTWPTSGDQVGTLRYSLDGEVKPPITADVEAGSYVARLEELPPLASLEYALWSGEQEVCQDQLINSPGPVALPRLYVSETSAGAWSRLVGVLMGSDYTLFSIDRQGRYRWHHTETSPDVALIDVHPTASGVLHNRFDEHRLRDIGEIRTLDWEGTVTDTRQTPQAHHVFAPLPDGGLAFLATEVREWRDPETGEQEAVVGDVLWERTPDGQLREVFNLWEHEEPVRHDRWDNDFYPQGSDWSHGNGLSYSADRGSFLVSFGHLDLIYEIDRTTGAPLLRIDPEQWQTLGSRLDFPHSPTWSGPDRLMVFSYGDGEGGAIEYRVDAEASVLEEVWSWIEPGPAEAFLGQAQRLSDDSVLISFGSEGRAVEIINDEVAWELETPLGIWLGSMRPRP